MQRWPLVLVVVLMLTLGILATLQVRWINQVSAAHEERTRREVAAGAARFNEEINRQLLQILQIFELRDVSGEALQRRYQLWRANASDPRLIARVDEVDDPSRVTFTRPAMIIPVGGEREGSAYIVVQLDLGYLSRVLLPDLSRRLFAADAPDGFDVAVARGGDIIYRSNPKWPASLADAHPDGAWPLFRMFRRERFANEEPSLWTLLVRHHGVPLAEAMAAMRRRDLAVAFAVLVILAASAVTLAIAARRAEMLRKQQLEFVAGITHELNTPLAALASAGQNLVDGVAGDAAEYGAMIVKETHRLIDLVDQVLQFGRDSISRTVVEPSAAICEAVSQCRWLAEDNGVRVDTNVGENLPSLRGDFTSIARAVQNLVANAIRHGGAGGRVGVRAVAEDGFVAITVEDCGPGIAPVDLPHLFEPFYRGRSAQTRGSGLGLTIVDRIARAHGGSVTVAQRKERGTAFTLRLPAA